MIKPVIFGLAGPTLLDTEAEFFTIHKPYGFILFARNCESVEQIRTLTVNLKALSSDRNVPIFIDQEGGRVARIKPPLASQLYPPAKFFDDMAKTDLQAAKIATYDNYKKLMSELLSLGINATCAPVVDLSFEGAHNIIGDRSFGSDPELVATLAIAAINGIQDAGGDGVIKHIPGHGRALCDSHHDLPYVNVSLSELKQTDFKAFALVAQTAKYAMTAHIVYNALDTHRPATLSPIVVRYIREKIGFSGLLMTDDLSMKALNAPLDELAQASLNAGCDLVLHCNGNINEMRTIADALQVTEILTTT